MAHKRNYTKTFRFKDELGQVLEQEALRQNRSVNNLVETMLEDSWMFRKYKPKRLIGSFPEEGGSHE